MTKSQLQFTNKKNYGQGVYYQSNFFYWKASLSRALILSNNLERKIKSFIKFIVILIAGISYLSLILFFTQYKLGPGQSYYLFWQIKHPLITIFLLSFGANLFLLYHFIQKASAERKINHKQLKRVSGKKYNINTLFSEDLLIVLEKAFLISANLKQRELTTRHFFRALLNDATVQTAFIRLELEAEDLLEKLDRYLIEEGTEDSRRPKISNSLEQLFIKAAFDALSHQQEAIEPLNTLLFIYQSDEILAEILFDLEIDADKILNVCKWEFIDRKIKAQKRSFRRLALLKPSTGMDRAYTSIATPTLDYFSHDLTLAAKFGRLNYCIGRNSEMNSIFEILASGQTGVLLVGADGVGRKTVISGIAQLMVEEKVPKFLQDKRLVEIDIARLVSGASPAEAQGRLLNCVYEAARARNIILYLDNVENLVGISSGSESSLDLSGVLADVINRKLVYCLATINIEKYNNILEQTALADVMTSVGIDEPGINETIQVLESRVARLESSYRVFISYKAIEKAVLLSSRFIHDKYLPKKAIEILELAVRLSAREGLASCSKDEVSRVFSETVGIPVQKLDENEGKALLELEKRIHERLIGQTEAVESVSASLRRARVEMKDQKRPIASFLFLGPTGVGKTELAKIVSDLYFGSVDYMLRLDMSEYQQADSIKKMIGDIDGTKGYLTEAARRKPFTLILLDEIEKAHPDILNLLLQLLDEGRLTDGQGRTISFTESIIIATSNIGALYIQDEIKKETAIERIKEELVNNQINDFMRPELVNRFDGIIVFKPLKEEEIFSIAVLMLDDIRKRLFDKGIGLKADKEGISLLAKEAYDPKFGARPLRRLLQDKIENEIANLILAAELKRRDTVLINSEAKILIEKGKEL